jgi:hypothetical protein
MKRAAILIFFFYLGFNLFAQQQDVYAPMINDYCREAQKKEIAKSPKNEIILRNLEVSAKIRKKYTDTIERIITEIMTENDSIDRSGAEIIFSKRFLYELIYNCDYYLEITRAAIDSCPPETPSLQYVAVKVNAYLARHPEFTAKEAVDSSMVQALTYCHEIPQEIKRDYGADAILIEPMVLFIYLLHKNDDYLRLWLYDESTKRL